MITTISSTSFATFLFSLIKRQAIKWSMSIESGQMSLYITLCHFISHLSVKNDIKKRALPKVADRALRESYANISIRSSTLGEAKIHFIALI